MRNKRKSIWGWNILTKVQILSWNFFKALENFLLTLRACSTYLKGFSYLINCVSKTSWPHDTPNGLYGRKSKKKVEILKTEAQNGVEIFWHSSQFLSPDLNFLGPETREKVFYHQTNATTFFLVYFFTLEYIMETFRAQFTNIFKKNARGGERACFPPPRFQYTKVCSRREYSS